MRIAHVTATFPPYRGGTGNVCFHNARELARRGHDVHVFTAATPKAPAYETQNAITIHRLRPLLRFGNAPVLPGLIRALRGFDILHLHYPFFGGEITTLAAHLNRTPLIVTYHQDVLLSGVLGAIERVLRWTLGRWTLRSAKRLLFTSRDYGQASYVQSFLQDRAHRIGALPNGVDATTFAPGNAASQFRTTLGVTADDRVALMVAGLDRAHYFKGVNVFLAALAHLPPTAKGVIVGDGDLRTAYETTAITLGLGDRVRFVGRVADQALPDYYRMADVTVLPSVTMGEAFGLVLVESLACGTPVIASDLPGVRTVVRKTQGGHVVTPGSVAELTTALEQMLNNDADRQAIGRRGQAEVAARYDWRQIGAQLETIYNDVLIDPQRPVVSYIGSDQ